eukprot:3936405-Rhodomonas_salina.1
MTRFVPCKSDPDNGKAISAAETARLYFQHVFRFHGLPALLRTDRGGQFTGEFFREIFRLCGTKQAFGSAYHPQSQGLTEHANRTGIEALRHHLAGVFEDWEEHLPAAEFALNHAMQPSMGVSPFEALYGYNPRTPLTLAAQTAIPGASTFMHRIRSQIEAATDAILEAQLKQAEGHSARTISFRVGDKALLSTRDLNLAYPTKLTPKYLGPFKVLEVMPTGNTVKLELPDTMKRLSPTFALDRLRPYLDRDADLPPSVAPPPPPAFVDPQGQDGFLIERIIAEKPCVYKGQRTVKYLVRWVGYGPEHDVWCEHP